MRMQEKILLHVIYPIRQPLIIMEYWSLTINPHDKECEIETGDNVWHSVEEMEAEKSEQFQEENAEADSEK